MKFYISTKGIKRLTISISDVGKGLTKALSRRIPNWTLLPVVLVLGIVLPFLFVKIAFFVLESVPLFQDQLHCSKPDFTIHNTHYFSPPPPLYFEPHHIVTLTLPQDQEQNIKLLDFCSKNFTNYCPCHDPPREKQFIAERRFHKQRHCPGNGEKPRCLVLRPAGYRRPFTWPKSRDYVWFRNMPFPRLTE